MPNAFIKIFTSRGSHVDQVMHVAQVIEVGPLGADPSYAYETKPYKTGNAAIAAAKAWAGSNGYTVVSGDEIGWGG